MKTPVWGRGHCWHASYIKKILSNPATIGEYQPCQKPRGKRRTAVGSVIKAYFPAVVDREVYFAVNEVGAHKLRAQQSGHTPLANLFAGLTKCRSCHGTMTYITKGYDTLADGSKVKRHYLKCTNHHRGVVKCDNSRAWNYALLEKTLLDHVLHYALTANHFQSDKTLSEARRERTVIVGEIAAVETQQKTLIKFVMLGDKVAEEEYSLLIEELKTLRSHLTDTDNLIDTLTARPAHSQRVQLAGDLRELMNSTDAQTAFDARRKIKSALNSCIEEVYFTFYQSWGLIAANKTKTLEFDINGKILHNIDILPKESVGNNSEFMSNLTSDPEYIIHDIHYHLNEYVKSISE